MFQYKDRHQVRMDKAKADEFLALNTYAGQRPKRPKRLEELRAKAIDGRLRVVNVDFAVLTYDNDRVQMVNGQHVSTVLSAIGDDAHVDAKHKSVLCDVTYYTCDTPDDLATLFGQFDDSGGTRTPKEIARTAQVRLGLDEWHGKTVQLMIGALSWLRMPGISESRMTRDQRAACLESQHTPSGNFVDRLLFRYDRGDRKDPKHLHRNQVIAAVIRTFLVSPSDAAAFWEAVRDGTMLSPDDPAFRLREYLLGDDAKQVTRNRDGQMEMFIKCVIAWNAFRSGRRTKLIYKRAATIPEPV